jgi:hypothetical protein
LRCGDRSHVCIQAHRLAQTLQQPPFFQLQRGVWLILRPLVWQNTPL